MSPRRGGLASSPNSGDDTTYGTPSTNATTFTPEAPGSKRRLPISAANKGLNIRIAKPASSGDDVFLNPPATTKRPSLSPTAQEFTPRLPAGLPTGHIRIGGEPRAGYVRRPQETGVRVNPSTRRAVPVPAPVAGVIGEPVNILREQLGALQLSDLHYNAFGGIYVSDVRLTEGTFSTDENVTRAFVVTGVPTDMRSHRIANTFKVASFPSIRTINASQVISNGLFTVSFADLRDAKRAYDVSTTLLPLTRVFPLTPKSMAADAGNDPSLVSDFEGQIIVSIYYNGNPTAPPKEAAPIVAEIKRLLTQCGDIKAMHSLPPTQLHVREFRVEFYNADHVDTAKDVISGTITHGTVLDVEPYKPDVRPIVAQLAEALEQPSITGRSTVPFDPDYDRLAYAIQRDGLRNGRRLNQNGNHNAVDIGRIQAGIDVRTTIMLRNIPNRVDQAMLKSILDVTSHGRYDFMYLRIDFANNCNVGYAFINFVDAPSIIPFLIARAGKRWNCFNSDKVAEISYATIQGKDCLVQKFRNSSVMLEHPAFRPKLYRAGNVTNAGQEEAFPGPDNHSKMRRSVENAEHVGLYIPLHLNPGFWYPNPCPAAAEYQRRGLRRTGKLNVDERRRNGFYLPPARATKSDFKETKDSEDVNPPPTLRRIPFMVDIRSPYDPFAGTPRTFSSFRT